MEERLSVCARERMKLVDPQNIQYQYVRETGQNAAQERFHQLFERLFLELVLGVNVNHQEDDGCERCGKNDSHDEWGKGVNGVKLVKGVNEVNEVNGVNGVK